MQGPMPQVASTGMCLPVVRNLCCEDVVTDPTVAPPLCEAVLEEGEEEQEGRGGGGIGRICADGR